MRDLSSVANLFGPLPQMGPVVALIPIAAIYFSVRRYGMMPMAAVAHDGLILSYETRFLAGFLVNRIYIKKINENDSQIKFQKLISEISFDFVSVNQNSVDAKINNLLQNMGRYFRVDRCYVFLINNQDDTMTYAYEWCNDGISPEVETIKDIPLETFPWWMGELKNNNLIYIDDVNKLPDEAAPEKEQLTRQSIKSVVIIPIEEQGELLGFIGLDSVVYFKRWSNHHIELLRILANLLADGLIKIKAEKEINFMAYYDHLTGLPNRTLFSDRLNQAVEQAKLNNGYVAVLFMDLDSFKTVNDTMGHSGGDTIIREVANGLVQRVQKTDTVARFGGDEFLILINNLEDSDSVVKAVDYIMSLFEKPFYIQGQEFFIGNSAGVAVYPFDGGDAVTLIKNADIAMYKAKSKGKNQYVLCTTDMKEEVNKNMIMSNHLYRALERNEFDVYYQPQIGLPHGRIVGLEALLRWKHPEMGLPHLRVAVNLSVVQFNNPHFITQVDNILKETGLDPKHLEFEITESIATQEINFTVNILNKLKKIGVFISIDDFGTEYSSLNRLKMLPIDRIKIDMQFIQGIESSAKDQAITKVIINLAKSLGLGVLAEGVETAPQLEFLNQRMCDDVQGYYYYRPMPATEIEKLLKTMQLSGWNNFTREAYQQQG